LEQKTGNESHGAPASRVHSRALAMSNAAASFSSSSDADCCAAEPAQGIDDAFRVRILSAVRDLRARERRASSVDLRPELRLGDAANDQ
jgi:hypothetical protein